MRICRSILAVAILITLTATAVTGCGKPQQPAPKLEAVTGKWVAVKKEAYALGGGQQVGFVIEFFGDKTVALPAGKGNWNILKDGRVEIKIGTATMLATLQDNMLTVTMPDNKGTVIFQKQQ